MKLKGLSILMAAITMMAIAMTACSSDDDMYFSKDEVSSSEEKEASVDDIINTSWIFYGFGSINKKEIREVKPSSWKDAYHISFQDDGIVRGTSSVNDFYSEYITEGTNIYINPNICTTKVGEIGGDGEEYMAALLSCSHYKISENQLFLYYNKGLNYLVFNSNNSKK